MINLLGAVGSIINKAVPSRKESAVSEMNELSRLLAEALKTNEDMVASQIRKRMKEVRDVYPDV